MEVMQQFNNSILHARTNLEYQTMDNNGTRNVVILIAFIQDSKCKIVKWGRDIKSFHKGQKTLIRQRYQFPNDWLYVEQIEGAFNEIFTRRNHAIQEQIGMYKQ